MGCVKSGAITLSAGGCSRRCMHGGMSKRAHLNLLFVFVMGIRLFVRCWEGDFTCDSGGSAVPGIDVVLQEGKLFAPSIEPVSRLRKAV